MFKLIQNVVKIIFRWKNSGPIVQWNIPVHYHSMNTLTITITTSPWVLVIDALGIPHHKHTWSAMFPLFVQIHSLARHTLQSASAAPGSSRNQASSQDFLSVWRNHFIYTQAWTCMHSHTHTMYACMHACTHTHTSYKTLVGVCEMTSFHHQANLWSSTSVL